MFQNFLPGMFFITILSGMIQGMTGFGFAIVFLALMQHRIPYGDLLTLTAILAIVMLIFNAWTYRRFILWKEIPIPLAINFVATIVSIQFLKKTLDFPYWHQLFGVVFLLLSIYLYLGQQKVRIQPTLKNAVLFCGLGGILGGLFGVGGPPVVLYFLAITKEKQTYLGTTQMFFLFNMLYDFTARCCNGMMTVSLFQYGVLMIPAVLVGLWIGNRLFQKVNEVQLKKMIYFLMFFDGFYMLLKG